MIGCPISAFGGIRDADVARDFLEGWKEHAPQGAFSLSLVPGNHFFLHQSMPVLVNRLLLVLAPLLHRLQSRREHLHRSSNTLQPSTKI
jgi:surfactin synthase thioesterase subunit